MSKATNIADWRDSSPVYTVALVTGGFDPVHSGHVSLMREAKEFGDELWVGVNSDSWLSRKKGKAFMCLEERMVVVSSIRYVSKALDLFDTIPPNTHRLFELYLSVTKFLTYSTMY